MRRLCIWVIVAMVLALATGAAATTFWLSQPGTSGAPIPGDQLNVAPSGSLTLECWMDGTDVGNTFEIMVGYDKSDAAPGAYGAGVDTNGAFKKLTFGPTPPTIDSFFDVFTAAGHASSQVVTDASGREDSNAKIGGKPYGFVGRAATSTKNASGKKKLFSFQLTNGMTVPNDFQYVVVSKYAGGKSYASAWKNGLALYEDDYFVKIVNAGTLPVVGATNRAILDKLMDTTAGSYKWVLWGIAKNVVAGSFDMDDGSGVVIHVVAAGHTVPLGSTTKYVSAKGTLDKPSKTLTSTGADVKIWN